MASVRKRGGRWYVRRYAGGKQVEEALGAIPERKAREIVRKIQAREILGLGLPARSRTPLAKFLEDFARHLGLTLRPGKSVRNDLSRLACFFREVKVDRLESLTPPLIRRTLELKRSRDGIAARTWNNYREIIHRMFAYAREAWEFVSPDARYPNPVDAVRKLPEPAPVISHLTLDEIDGLLSRLAGDLKMQAAVATLIYTGLRRSELLWLTTDDLDLQTRLVMVRGKTVDGESWQPKTRKNRAVPVSGSLLPYLRWWMRMRPESVWLFSAPRGGRWGPDNFSHALRAAQKGLEKRWSCLDFRHTFASHLARKGVSIFKIARLLGNTVPICERHYAHLCPAGLADEVEFHAPRPDMHAADAAPATVRRRPNTQTLAARVSRLMRQK